MDIHSTCVIGQLRRMFHSKNVFPSQAVVHENGLKRKKTKKNKNIAFEEGCVSIHEMWVDKTDIIFIYDMVWRTIWQSLAVTCDICISRIIIEFKISLTSSIAQWHLQEKFDNKLLLLQIWILKGLQFNCHFQWNVKWDDIISVKKLKMPTHSTHTYNL